MCFNFVEIDASFEAMVVYVLSKPSCKVTKSAAVGTMVSVQRPFAHGPFLDHARLRVVDILAVGQEPRMPQHARRKINVQACIHTKVVWFDCERFSRLEAVLGIPQWQVGALQEDSYDKQTAAVRQMDDRCRTARRFQTACSR
ncbi:hypothetical protein NX059_012453 [Plenodomus lindquistii]|nr:hypothetical protein NX059_012453 [Plenodomus lindquistii]